MTTTDDLSFWEHLDVLRGCLLRILGAFVTFGIAAFCLKDTLFAVLLAPKDSHFITYRLLHTEPFSIQLVNIGLTEQFFVHMKTALSVGVLCASPYILYQLYRFISPALYSNERRYVVRAVGCSYVMFMVGVAANYFLVFPLTVHFLGTYQVSAEVMPMLSLESYIDTLLMMSLVFGLVFEIPVVSGLLAVMGVLHADWMRKFRRHAIVVILIVAAVITPTSDIFTLLIVSLPIWLLYEVSIGIVKRCERSAAFSPDPKEKNKDER